MSEPLIFRLHESCYKYREGATPSSVTTAVVNKVDFDKDEGFLSYFNGLKLPRPSVLNIFALRGVDSVKKYIKAWLRVLTHPFSFKRIFLEQFQEFAFNELQEFVLKEQFWPRAVREINRLGLLFGFDEKIVEPICVILDQDLAYRWRLQDVLSSMDTNMMQKNPARETKRLFNLLSSRDEERQSKNWRPIGWLVYLVMLIFPSARRLVRQLGKEMRPDRMVLNENDLYNCLLQTGYDYFGLNQAQRAEMHKIRYMP